MSTTLLARPSRRGALAAQFWRIGACLALAISHLLLPVERGFPLLRVYGVPLTACLATSLVVFGIMLLESQGRILQLFKRKYAASQVVFVVALVLSSFMSSNIKSALSIPAAYFATFVLDFLTITYLFETGYRKTFLRILVGTLFFAAGVGIAEGMFSTKLDFYTYYGDLFQLEMGYGDFVGSRVFGTLGNPIIYGSAMMLGIPFAAHLHRPWRYLLVAMLSVAAVVTVSRTVLLMSAPLLAGVLVMRVKQRWIKLLGGAVAVSAVAAALNGGALIGKVEGVWRDRLDSIESQWTDRLLKDYDAEQNIAIRLEALRAVLTAGAEESPLSVLLGHGPRSGTEVARGISLRFDTLDNAYATLYFESGILGLLAYFWVYGSLLFRNRAAMRTSYHWYGVVAFLASGFAFVSVYYVTFPLLVVTSTVMLTAKDAPRRRVPVMPGPHVAFSGPPPAGPVERMRA